MITFRIGLLLGSLLLLHTLRMVRAQADSFGEQCLDNFKKGKEEFILDTDESVKEGASFLASPPLTRMKDCIRSCCKDPTCNLAMMEDGEEEGLIKACFLLNCLYKKKYVCRFVKKKGFTNYILSSVFSHYLDGPHTVPSKDADKPPVAVAGLDRVVQPQDTVTLDGFESKDDKKITSYEWHLIKGSPFAVLEKTNLDDQIRVSNLSSGVYKLQLTVTDSAGQSDSAEVTILVLTPEQSHDHCMAPKKIGPCRGSFPRWHYNAATEECQQFSFGGCKENMNNYLSLQECNKACEGVSAVKPDKSGRMLPRPSGEVCGATCGPDQFTCANGCCIDKALECDKNQQCSDGSDETSCQKLDESFTNLLKIPLDEGNVRCTEPPKTGVCRASMTKWYYNPFVRKCFRFNYGGCDGNDNRFEEESSCMKACQMVTESDVFGRATHEYQEGQKAQAGTIAIAVLLGVAILIMLAILGYCYLKGRKKRQQPQRVAVNGSHVTTREDMEHLVYNSTTKPI
ncbi:kunitz-type protease inhibitor 1a [Conger conger]|uniref:kunitz-type protease inhibitor 1a n=1 Tax=Conger conger TaxID=82655 RepID=UPI002A5A5A8E|nr:kunitz-type protease inhibitor 1a [Conger conger]